MQQSPQSILRKMSLFCRVGASLGEFDGTFGPI